MADDKKRPAAVSSEWETIYRLHRERVAQEETLIYHRTWGMVTTQAILFVLLKALIDVVEQTPDNTVYNIVLRSFCIFGAFAAGASLFWLVAAVQEIEKTKKSYNEIRANSPFLKSPEETIFESVVGRPDRHLYGLIGVIFLPGFFLLSWLLVLFFFLPNVTGTFAPPRHPGLLVPVTALVTRHLSGYSRGHVSVRIEDASRIGAAPTHYIGDTANQKICRRRHP